MRTKINILIFITSFLVAIYGFVYLNNKIASYERRLGSTITTIQANDLISASRAVINTNLSNLNTDKLESGSSASSLTISALTSGILTTGSFVSTSTATSTMTGDLYATFVAAPIFNATSTTATSTFSYGLNLTGGCLSISATCLPSLSIPQTWSAIQTISQTYFASSSIGRLTVGFVNATSSTASYFTGNIGIATTSPSTELAVTGSATTTLFLTSSTANAGGCIQLKDADGTGWFRAYATSAGPLYLENGTCK